MSPEPNHADDLVRQAQETPAIVGDVPPAVFRSPSGRIVLTLKPWYDDDHDQMMRELDGIIAAPIDLRHEDRGRA